MVQVYDAVNKDNQIKFKGLINKNLEGFELMRKYSIKNAKFKN